MKIQVFQHAPFEGPGAVADWAKDRGHSMDVVHLYRGDRPALPEGFDWLVVMGGPMNVYEEEAHPWLRVEKAAIREAIDAGKIVVGICLGAQLIANVLGAGVRCNRCQEIGWFPIEFTPDAAHSPLRDFAAAPLTVLHWHGDTFDLPEGAVRLAGSEACANQAFSFGDRVLALQCHLECTPDGVERFLAECPPPTNGGAFVQVADELRAGEADFTRTGVALFAILDRLAEAVHRP